MQVSSCFYFSSPGLRRRNL